MKTFEGLHILNNLILQKKYFPSTIHYNFGQHKEIT